MSEAEKIRRSNYRQNRKKWILIQASAILLVAIIALSMLVIYLNLNKTYYVSFTEEGDADYSVVLKDNDFYEENTVSNGKGYISELIDSINMTFRYKMQINSSNVKYEYTDHVEARIEITDNSTKKVIYSPTFTLVDSSTARSANKMYISRIVSVDYGSYNKIAADFIDAYSLENVESRLIVSMHTDISGNSDEFTGTAANDYSSSVIIPLCKKTISIETSASSPSGELKLLPCRRDTNPTVFSVLAIVFTVFTVLLAVTLVGFIYITRNDDINYEIKIKRLLNSYRSYIQIITNEFDSTDYQTLNISSFNEMLGIRDTIQSPILMNENPDKTRTLFFIPTNTKILYVFEVKVEDYDKIYSKEAADELIENEENTEPIAEEPPVAEDLPLTEDPMPDPAAIDYAEDEDIEDENGVEVIGVVWPEHNSKNKVYKYDPDGEMLEEGDIVLVPSRDVEQDKDIVRQAAVVHKNHKVDPATLKAPLKKIIGVVRRGIRSQLEKP